MKLIALLLSWLLALLPDGGATVPSQSDVWR